MREKMKQWFPIWKHILAVIVLALFVGLMLWNRGHHTGYFPEWLSRRGHIWGCVVAILLAYWGKWAVSAGLTLGWVAGVPIAQLIGDAVYAHHQAIYTAEEMVRIGHKHAYIWWLCIAIGFLLGVLVQVVLWLCRRDRKRLPPVDSRELPQHRAV